MIFSTLLILMAAGWGLARSECILTETFDSDFYYRRCRYQWIDDNYKLICHENNISCYNTTLWEIFEESAGSVHSVRVTNSTIRQLSNGIDRNITTLELNGVGLESIESGFFDHFLKLQVLELPNNHLSTLEPTVFHPLKELLTLKLPNNSIVRLNSRTFSELENLQVIDLKRNRLSSLPDGLFVDQSYLELDLTGNELTEGDVVQLIESNSSIIRTAALGHNKISSLNTTGAIRFLNLTGNLLEKLGDNFAQPLLMTIDLSHNEIARIEPNAFALARRLSSIYLNDNKLRSLPIGCFSSLGSLEVLNLARNYIHAISFGLLDRLVALRRLDLSHNAMTLDFHKLLSLTQLEILDISGCDVGNLNAELLVAHFPKLKTVSVDNGAWNCAQLARIVNHLRKAEVEVSQGEVRNASNVLGISCQDNGDEEDITFDRTDQQDPSALDLRPFFKYTLDRYENMETRTKRIWQILQANANDSTAFLKRLSKDYRAREDQFADYFSGVTANRIVSNLLLLVICAFLVYGVYLMRKRRFVAEQTQLL